MLYFRVFNVIFNNLSLLTKWFKIFINMTNTCYHSPLVIEVCQSKLVEKDRSVGHVVGLFGEEK